ncbi:MAG: polysaccharide export protein [Myxococcales bacterium]|nr:MAG: polysaccharide export protein [Myxococcales bacterium]
MRSSTNASLPRSACVTCSDVSRKAGGPRRWAGAARLGLVLALLGPSAGCTTRVATGGTLPAPSSAYTLGPGDRFELIVVGEGTFPKDYTVASDGTIDLPLLHRQVVSGYEAQDLASHLRQLMIEGKFLKDPVIIVTVREFNSKRITVGGAITKPGDYAFTPGLTLLRIISSAGGFTPGANRSNVLITRRTTKGQRVTVPFSVDAISEGRTSDVPLQAGDNVYVHESKF